MTGSYQLFAGEALLLGPTLVCPVKVMYQEYFHYCAARSLLADPPREFVGKLELEDGVTLSSPEGKGRLKRLARGIGFRQTYSSLRA